MDVLFLLTRTELLVAESVAEALDCAWAFVTL